MGNSAKKSDYKASEAEQASASVAMAEYDYFKQKYDPLLQQMRDKSMTEDIQSGLRGRANADTMQALSTPNYLALNRSDASGDVSQALSGQLGVANTSAKNVQNTMQSNVLGTARGQAADAQSGMAAASRLATSEALTRARAKEDVAQAKLAAAVRVGSTLAAQGFDNMGTSGVDAAGNPVKGSFFTPVAPTGEKFNDKSIVSPVQGARGRLGYSTFFG